VIAFQMQTGRLLWVMERTTENPPSNCLWVAEPQIQSSFSSHGMMNPTCSCFCVGFKPLKVDLFFGAIIETQLTGTQESLQLLEATGSHLGFASMGLTL